MIAFRQDTCSYSTPHSPFGILKFLHSTLGKRSRGRASAARERSFNPVWIHLGGGRRWNGHARRGGLPQVSAFCFLPSAFPLDGAGVFAAQGARGWRSTGVPDRVGTTYLFCSRSSSRLQRFKCSTAVPKVSASDRFWAPCASPSRNPSASPTVAIWSPSSQKCQK